jgi:hypothetical protein
MKLRTVRVLAICGTMVLLACVPGTAGARSATGRHCVFRLVPESRPKAHVISARLERVGCFDTFSEAIEAGSGGSIKLALSIQPADLTNAMIADTTVSRVGDDTLIGTEWGASGFGGISNNYMAPNSCVGTIYEVAYVGDAWNDKFESGKGFGGCDTNKKFVHSDFGGDVLTCTPNCSNYASLANEVSSLKWKP